MICERLQQFACPAYGVQKFAFVGRRFVEVRIISCVCFCSRTVVICCNGSQPFAIVWKWFAQASLYLLSRTVCVCVVSNDLQQFVFVPGGLHTHAFSFSCQTMHVFLCSHVLQHIASLRLQTFCEHVRRSCVFGGKRFANVDVCFIVLRTICKRLHCLQTAPESLRVLQTLCKYVRLRFCIK